MPTPAAEVARTIEMWKSTTIHSQGLTALAWLTIVARVPSQRRTAPSADGIDQARLLLTSPGLLAPRLDRHPATSTTPGAPSRPAPRSLATGM
jgi:hypothetical protein